MAMHCSFPQPKLVLVIKGSPGIEMISEGGGPETMVKDSEGEAAMA
jgi:hypothetical protein